MHGRLFVIRVIIDAWQKIIQSNCTRTVIYITATFSYRTVHTLTLVSTSLQRLPLYKSHFSTKATSLSPKGGRFGRVQRKWNGEYDFVHILRKMADMGKFANWSKSSNNLSLFQSVYAATSSPFILTWDQALFSFRFENYMRNTQIGPDLRLPLF